MSTAGFTDDEELKQALEHDLLVAKPGRALDPAPQLDLSQLAQEQSRKLAVHALVIARLKLADCDALLKDSDVEDAAEYADVVERLLCIAERADALADKILTASGK